MKLLPLCAAALLLAFAQAAADDTTGSVPPISSAPDSPYFVSTTWGPGIQLRLIGIRRIIDNRLLAVFWIEATKDAPASGTLISGGLTQPPPGGLPEPTPGYNKLYPKIKFIRQPIGFRFTGAMMTDDLTKTQYPQLSPVAPPGVCYTPPACLGTIKPGKNLLFTLQFAVPPPPPPPVPGQPPPIQTLSFLVPTATGPIVKAPIPPLLPATPAVHSASPSP